MGDFFRLLLPIKDYLLLESFQLHIIAKYGARDCAKIRPDLLNLFLFFSFLKSMKSAKFPFQLF